MRAVTFTAAAAAVLLLASAVSAGSTLGSFSCPSSGNIGCYCSVNCAVLADTRGRSFKSPVFPPVKVNASAMGTDNICAKVTIPYLTSDVNVLTLAAYVGIDNFASSKTEVTVWTSFTANECAAFQYLAAAAVKSTPAIGNVGIGLCNSDGCNTVNMEGFSASPAPTAGNNLPSLLPGGCPVSGASPASCYCTNGCSVNGESTFTYKSSSWPPVAVNTSTVGTKTICAKITTPIYTALATGVALNTFLSTSGNYDGLVVTTYTAFTAAECASYVATAQTLLATNSVQLGIELCNTTNCNSVTSTNNAGSSGGSGSGGSASSVAVALAAAAALAMTLLA